MKRDMDLIRKILLALEERQDYSSRSDFKVEGYPLSSLEVHYHLILLYEAGLIEGSKIPATNNSPVMIDPVRLTWTGHEFLDVSRNPTSWKNAKEIGQKVGGVSFDVLKQVLTELGKRGAFFLIDKLNQ